MSKLKNVGQRLTITAEEATIRLSGALTGCGCPVETVEQVTAHLVDASLCGVESHGIMRVLQYVQQFNSGMMDVVATPRFLRHGNGSVEIDGCGGIGIPAMSLALEHVAQDALTQGIAAIAIRNTGHTGRLGAFAEDAATRGLMTIILGGGNRKTWRQVAPYGGRRAKLPTNPYCIGIPGGDRGPVVLDFATAKIAGGWIYAAQSAGATLPEGMIVDRDGRPTVDPQDYFDGGAILPAGGAKGYALALMAELVGEAMLGPVTTECNWLMIALDTNRFRSSSTMQEAAEDLLADIRNCPPSPGFDQVEVPGERERANRRRAQGRIAVPASTWQQIQALPG